MTGPLPLLRSKEEKDWTRRIGNERHLICIEDPFETSHDLGRVVDRHSIRVRSRAVIAQGCWRPIPGVVLHSEPLDRLHPRKRETGCCCLNPLLAIRRSLCVQ